jgi:tetratricopeptide (TPR) repeat protein
VVARPRDAVHWALYYPPVIDVANAPGYRAQTLLAVGAVDEARSDIGRALQSAPNDASALSLQSIMAVVQGEKDQALQLAQAAVAADPKSATALISRSYAEQARFDLNAARASAQQATQLEPNNALAWARLAELHSSFGDLKASLAAARRAVEINPNLSRTQTVLGFAHLTSIQTAEAKAAFEKAISLDQADPLPRLGMGLALIREGDLGGGSRQIEVAASLDPNNALVRSYLGKAYYEEKRGPQDEREFGVAKQLDPKDPTPWFYDAIAKQTTNRPVEALQDMENAIERNENRAVYRSQLLLDSDAAARSASQARIYSDLGFQPLALVEGWKSVNTDPSNFSAHRFLADSYAALPRHEVARVSELLQSQLLQPLSLTPLQPRLAESNLFLISAGGPGTLSFNEFNPIFNRDGAVFQATGLVGNNDTAAGEGVVAGLFGRTAFSAGLTSFRTDGWRTNADQDDLIANAFMQVALSAQSSIQGEYRYRENEFGDLRLRFFPEDFFPGQRNREETELFRLGGRHDFSPGSIVLLSTSYQQTDIRQRDEQFPQAGVRFVDLHEPSGKAFGIEVQHLLRAGWLNLRSGLGYFNTDGGIETRLGFGPPLAPFNINLPATTLITHIDHYNAYAYADINALRGLTLSVGGSYDSVQGSFPVSDNTNQFNPKVGVTWNPYPGTTVRAAATRVLKRTLISQQTLEPTQVAGFNQFYDDLNLTDATRYGAALDQKFSRTVFGGVEASKRELEVPFADFAANPIAPPTRDANWDEELLRAYLFWTPRPWVALRAEYMFERLERDALPAGVRSAKTHRVPLGVRFFHSSGVSASLTGTYYDQEGEFGGITAATPIRAGEDRFWLVDAALSYRLPKRYGFLSVGVANMFDEDFRYFENDLRNVSIQPGTTVFARATLALP